jgi:hypothetical protein
MNVTIIIALVIKFYVVVFMHLVLFIGIRHRNARMWYISCVVHTCRVALATVMIYLITVYYFALLAARISIDIRQV